MTRSTIVRVIRAAKTAAVKAERYLDRLESEAPEGVWLVRLRRANRRIAEGGDDLADALKFFGES